MIFGVSRIYNKVGSSLCNKGGQSQIQPPTQFFCAKSSRGSFKKFILENECNFFWRNYYSCHLACITKRNYFLFKDEESLSYIKKIVSIRQFFQKKEKGLWCKLRIAHGEFQNSKMDK